MPWTFLLFTLFISSAVRADAPEGPVPSYTPLQTRDHIGEYAMVCGVVSSARFLEESNGQPTLLNLDRPWPKHVFTVVIWQDVRALFPVPPDEYYRYASICVTGPIRSFQGLPQIPVYDPSQITLPDQTPTPASSLDLGAQNPVDHSFSDVPDVAPVPRESALEVIRTEVPAAPVETPGLPPVDPSTPEVELSPAKMELGD